MAESNGITKAVLVKISEDTHRRLKERAERERRAMSHQAAVAIEEQLEREPETPGKA